MCHLSGEPAATASTHTGATRWFTLTFSPLDFSSHTVKFIRGPISVLVGKEGAALRCCGSTLDAALRATTWLCSSFCAIALKPCTSETPHLALSQLLYTSQAVLLFPKKKKKRKERNLTLNVAERRTAVRTRAKSVLIVASKTRQGCLDEEPHREGRLLNLLR